jgi:hypothetical protein
MMRLQIQMKNKRNGISKMKKYFFFLISLVCAYGSHASAQTCDSLSGGLPYSVGQQACFGRGWNSTTLNTCGGDGKWQFGPPCKCGNPFNAGAEDGWSGCNSDWSLGNADSSQGGNSKRLIALLLNIETKR